MLLLNLQFAFLCLLSLSSAFPRNLLSTKVLSVRARPARPSNDPTVFSSLSDIKSSLNKYGPIPSENGNRRRHTRDWVAFRSCVKKKHYNITSEGGIQIAPQLITGATCNGSYSTCSVGSATGYATTFTVAFGVDISVAEVVGAGVHADVAISETSSVQIAVSVNCPQSFTCGLQATATMWNVTGWVVTKCDDNGDRTGCACEKPLYEPYEIHLPVILKNVTKESQAMLQFGPCIERDSVNSYRRPPSMPLCPLTKAPVYKGGKKGIITG